ncbi:GM13770 [Drosophila sechellia]|uniref:GM13770 n=1 Tax=Drosophila sechellia TaxID=7238 RepID=B4HV50_DROSE|nr:GM13770 [Drosophila sechellia]
MMTEKIRKSSLSGYTVLLLLAAIQFQARVVSSTTTKPSSTLATSTKASSNVNPLTESKLEKNCKALCEHCGCLGFYCGEECLCEYDRGTGLS